MRDELLLYYERELAYLREMGALFAEKYPKIASRLVLEPAKQSEDPHVERLIEAVCSLDYPRDRFEVQVLDDSTDETTGVAREIVERYARGSVGMAPQPIVYLHRSNRHGYKAGALDKGLDVARGEFVAIFDADFVPPP